MNGTSPELRDFKNVEMAILKQGVDDNMNDPTEEIEDLASDDHEDLYEGAEDDQ